MEHPEFPYPNDTSSYPSHTVVAQYLQSLANNLTKNPKIQIKLSHLVTQVYPIENNRWKITVSNLKENKIIETFDFDAVFVANGHHQKPFYPSFPGKYNLKQKIIHSHEFRTAKAYQGNAKAYR